jgi:phosphoribosylamine--glycine ligase
VKLLVLGSGGREHALAWRLSRDPDVTEVLSAPGNPGLAELGRVVPADLSLPEGVLALARREQVDLTVVGPEAPLERGVADAFRAAGVPIVGPSKHGAALECSKAFAKAFMARHRIPTAEFAVCDMLDEALAAVSGDRFGFPVVIKADGLAAGKGVVIAADRAEAEAAVRAAMVERQFGAAGARLVIEECLTGPEVSYFVLADGREAIDLGTAHDHKRIFDDDRGPNTGGMGAFAPSPILTADQAREVRETIVAPVLAGFAAEGDPYRGFLYVSLMLTPRGIKVIEFNVRLGDPETQAILPLLEGPFARALMASAVGRVRETSLRLSGQNAVGVVVASRGYPATADPGRVIHGLDAVADRDVFVFHSGTRRDGSDLVTAGGRVLTVVARGATYEAAMDQAYTAVAGIRFDGMQYRRDIGRKATLVERPVFRPADSPRPV